MTNFAYLSRVFSYFLIIGLLYSHMSYGVNKDCSFMLKGEHMTEVQKLEAEGFVDIQTLSKEISVDLAYAKENNFLNRIVYPSNKAFFRGEVAQALVRVQKRLNKLDLRLKILDAYRPFHVQELMWAILPDPNYVGKPSRTGTELISGSNHSRGAAIDVTLVDRYGVELVMPSEFDDFSERAHRKYDHLDPSIKENILILEKVMSEEGFVGWPYEWWHYDFKNWENYSLSDLSLPKDKTP